VAKFVAKTHDPGAPEAVRMLAFRLPEKRCLDVACDATEAKVGRERRTPPPARAEKLLPWTTRAGKNVRAALRYLNSKPPTSQSCLGWRTRVVLRSVVGRTVSSDGHNHHELSRRPRITAHATPSISCID
jgi:hypothetical protein